MPQGLADQTVAPRGLPSRDGAQSAEAQRALAASLGLELVESLTGRAHFDPFVVRVPIGFAREHSLIGLAGPGDDVTVAFAGMSAWEQLDVVARYLRVDVTPVVAPPAVIAAAINEAYQQRSGQAQQLIETMDPRDVLAQIEELAAAKEDLLDVASRAPVIKLVNLMLFEAVRALASDVHVQPYEDRLAVRLRVDGVLYDVFTLPKHLQEEVVSRVKVMGRMNIAEKRLPQDGRATVQVGDRTVDLRIASLPTSFGERVVIRLLDKGARLYRLEELGMPPDTLATFRRLISLEHGLLLVTGPTGSGKTTTLYAALKELDSVEHNILTLEDPIEYQLEGISQTQVSDKKGMTFASGLRSVLRQDPDVIMVGEVRDRETAAMAIQSALTGHLVFSTLHTNDAPSAVARLLDLGVEPYLVASSLVGVLAQRLVRRVCDECAQSGAPGAGDGATSGGNPGRDGGSDATSVRRGPGCASCRGSGYRGRLGIFELLEVDDTVRGHVQRRSPAALIRAAATRTGGMRSLRNDGERQVRAGMTTIEEVERVTVREACGTTRSGDEPELSERNLGRETDFSITE
jgi:general secretion pathway protein E